MKIYAMTATFGKLEHQTLTLQPGLNIIEAPNEWGKSTWCAFLTAMLYGLDTRAKSTKTALADKERYAPWSGLPMEGRMEICWQSRDITIERRTKGRIPMGDFRAYETASGIPVPELNARNCGELLLGVERSVFLRSAMIRFSDLPVTGDEALRQRLHALVTTGDESAAGERLAKQLKELKNRCRYNRTGLLPQAEGELAAVEDTLSEMDRLEAASRKLRQRQAENAREIARLEHHAAALAYRAAKEDASRVDQAWMECREAENRAQDLASCCENLPPMKEIVGKLKELDACEASPWSGKIGPLLWMGSVVLGLGILLAVLVDLAMGLIAGAVGLCLLIGGLLRKPKTDAVAVRNQRRAQWEEARRQWEACEVARQDAARARAHLEVLRAMAKPLPRAAQSDLTLSAEETDLQLRTLRAEEMNLENRLSQYAGRMEAMGNRGLLEKQRNALTLRIKKLEETYAALTLAQETLAEAAAQLQRRFAPRIAKGAARRMEVLTGGRYQRLQLGEDFSLLAGTAGEDTLREDLWRSDGTADQLYLALRLAVAEALIPKAPLILDDALVRFDDARLKAALGLLEEEAQSRQVILFTCQSREKNLL